ncbi:lactate utilization protein [Salinisphaera sp. USBA-960]|uniref:lactate utilization protein B n=1 Tax=Salinisphaera orenii TaxID=856731 RepID=UPI000DBE3FE4|nr:lactate utilization protein [Salifodinibacter halophilus]NNC27119.1 lactate utilization protein [Salifodinibacter halophilus]
MASDNGANATSEAQPRPAKPGAGKRVDHAAGARQFLAATEHAESHDERVWAMRQRRDAAVETIPEWEELRDLASQIKTHALTHLDEYLEQFEANAKANGIHVHWAADAADHNRIVHEIFQENGVQRVIKSKSMLMEECGFRQYMDAAGFDMIETDLGERIQQLDDEDPSHVVVPAVHKMRSDVSQVFSKTLDSDPGNDDAHYLTEHQRQATRPLILDADAGMTGANFAIAETGGFVVCTNEGNADLSANVPNLHVASIGIEKVVPRVEDMGVFIRMLSRSALGSPITQYTSHFRGPKPGGETHIVLVDNGRSERLGSEKFWSALKCIRCGACMNTCPVFRRSGGLSYGATYTGPLGLILDPSIDARRYSNLPFASTLNGSCTNVCPVKINIHEQIFEWRKVLAEDKQVPWTKRSSLAAAGRVLASPKSYRAALKTAHSALHYLPDWAIYNRLNAWGQVRDLPDVPAEGTFHDWYRKHRLNTAEAGDNE